MLDYRNLFFIFNKSSYPELESGFYSIYELNYDNYAKHLNGGPSFSDNRLSEKLSDGFKEGNNQVNVEVVLSDSFMNEEVSIESKVKLGRKEKLKKIKTNRQKLL